MASPIEAPHPARGAAYSRPVGALQVLDAATADTVRQVCDAIVPGSARVQPEVYVDAPWWKRNRARVLAARGELTDAVALAREAVDQEAVDQEAGSDDLTAAALTYLVTRDPRANAVPRDATLERAA